MRSRIGLVGWAAIVAIAGLVVGCGGAGNPTSSAAPTEQAPTGVPAPALVTDVTVPQRFYGLALPAGWSTTLGAKVGDADTFSGPEGSLSVEFVPIPAGTAQDAWADVYQTAQIKDFAAGCFIGSGAASEDARIGPERGLLFHLTCLPGWMLLTAYGDRGYDLRFTSANSADPTNGKQLFLAILASFSFNVAPTP